MKGFVYIIGAGCGKYDLLTLRGLNALKKCVTVVYDALIDPVSLSYAPENAELIPVGKRAGAHSAKQEDINALLVEKALEGRTVARLKGGDPFVFGRGGEEIQELQKHGIGFEVIPGISSCVAVPELSGIPVTHRNVSRAFHVITAHTADDRQDFSQYAALDGTLVFLMGLKALPDIASGLMRGGKPADTPAAVISQGGTDQQRTVRGTLADIVENAAEMPAPGVIVVGETAAYDLSGTGAGLPLSGVSVTVTGTRKFSEKLGTMLETEGAQVNRYRHLQVIRTADIPTFAGYDCIAFTSSYGVEMFTDHCRKTHTDIRSLTGAEFAVIGSGTAETLAAAGIYADIIPDKYTAAGLGRAIADKAPGRVLILRAERGSEELCKVLNERGIVFDDVKIYDTVSRGIPPINAESDYIVFGSSYGVKCFFENGSRISGKTKVVCIGNPTADTARKYTRNIIITAVTHSAEGAAAAIKGDTENEKVQKTQSR